MVATSLPDLLGTKVLQTLQAEMPDVRFTPGQDFRWSPTDNVISYPVAELEVSSGIWSLLHEASHAKLEHLRYDSDLELLKLEVAAWKEAVHLGKSLFSTNIDEDHIQDCLDTYRDWVHRRSTCPACGIVGSQHASTEYHCHNCNATWTVTAARFCRPYRRKVKATNKSLTPKPEGQPAFH